MLRDFTEWLLDLSDSANTFTNITKTPSQDFELWFLANGGYINPAIEITWSPSNGNFLRIAEDQAILPGATIISCPCHLHISWPSIRNHHLSNVGSAMKPHVATRLFLMKQYLLKESSPWFPYIEKLPKPYQYDAFNTPLYYNADDLAWIRGTNMEYARKVRKDAWRNEYDDAMQDVLGHISTAEHTQLWTWELYVWAATIMTSRCFPGPATYNRSKCDEPAHTGADDRSPVIIPGLDFLNHNPSAKVAWLWDSASCSIRTEEIVCGGSQVWNNYGPKSNAELIMGYGFSLPDNRADHFSIGFAPAISAYIKGVKSRRSALCLGSEHDQASSTIFINGESKQKGGHPLESVDITGTEERADQDIHWVSAQNKEIRFSPYFLEDLSIAVENPRERVKADSGPPASGSFWNSLLSRNKLHVICAVAMILEKGQAAIKKHDEELTQCPQSCRQIDAGRYRQSQLRILEIVLDSLCGALKSYVGTNTTDIGGNTQTIRLEHVLTSTPKMLLKDFRGVLNAGMRTRDPAKIRARGGTDFTFTIWLCGLWVCAQNEIGHNEEEVHPDAKFEPCVLRRFTLLFKAYSEDAVVSQAQGGPEILTRNMDGTGWFDPVRNTETEGDLGLVVASYLKAIDAAVAKHPLSLYNNPKITAERLQWCLNIVRMEGVWYPKMQEDGQEEDDEWVLFLDFEPTERDQDHVP